MNGTTINMAIGLAVALVVSLIFVSLAHAQDCELQDKQVKFTEAFEPGQDDLASVRISLVNSDGGTVRTQLYTARDPKGGATRCENFPFPSNLAPGDYTMVGDAIDVNGVESEMPGTFEFTVPAVSPAAPTIQDIRLDAIEIQRRLTLLIRDIALFDLSRRAQ